MAIAVLTAASVAAIISSTLTTAQVEQAADRVVDQVVRQEAPAVDADVDPAWRAASSPVSDFLLSGAG